MKVSKQLTASVAVAFGLAIAGANAFAHPGGMGQGGMRCMGHGMMGGGMAQGASQADANRAACDGMGAGAMRGGMGQGQGAPGAKSGERGPMGGQSLMTPEERQAMRDKMRNAATPEERQQIAQANRAEMQKRAQEKGVTLPEARGPRGRFGPNATPAPQSPTTTE